MRREESGTGLRGSVLLVGPDGAGKTAIGDSLVNDLRDRGVEVTRAHSRPGILNGSRQNTGPVTEPHRKAPRRSLFSLAKLALVLADHVLGRLVRWRLASRDGVLVVERGWHDMAVDPRRYRLPSSFAKAVTVLGRVISRYDLTVVLVAPADALHARKPELGVEEIARQQRVWRELAPTTGRDVLWLDTVSTSVMDAGRLVAERLERPQPAGWIRAPLSPSRLKLRILHGAPSAPALDIYRPLRRRARAAARVNAELASRGIGWQVAPPVSGHNELAAVIGVEFDGVASMNSSMCGRLIIGYSFQGSLRAIVKVGSPDDAGLKREIWALTRLSGVRGSLCIPHLLWHGEWDGCQVVAMKAVAEARAVAFNLDTVADLCTALCNGLDGDPIVHGDFAPWNLIAGSDGTYLIDWEDCRQAYEPLNDLAHYVLRSGALLGWHTPSDAARVLTSRGSPGWRHLEAIGVDPTTASKLLAEKLQRAPADHQRIRRFETRVFKQI